MGDYTVLKLVEENQKDQCLLITVSHAERSVPYYAQVIHRATEPGYKELASTKSVADAREQAERWIRQHVFTGFRVVPLTEGRAE